LIFFFPVVFRPEVFMPPKKPPSALPANTAARNTPDPNETIPTLSPESSAPKKPKPAPIDETAPLLSSESPARPAKEKPKPAQDLEATQERVALGPAPDPEATLLTPDEDDSPEAPPSQAAEEEGAEDASFFQHTQGYQEAGSRADDPSFEEGPEAAAPAAEPPAGKAKSAAGPSGPGTRPAGAATVTLGDYRLVKKLGEGGMGAVYKGRHDTLERDVAIKVMVKKLAADKTFVQRFYREARIMAKLDHPNIVRCYAVGEDKGFHYLAMEFVDGGSIQDWLKKQGKFSMGDALHVILACADALQHAHDLGLIHRDIKPENILLTRKGVVKVADLGLAKTTAAEDMSLTRTGVGAGTPYYMAPEQARDAKHVDHRCDIYALGCMLYCFVTGKLPFQGETTLALIQAKEAGKFPPARRSNSEVPERLDLIMDKMLAKSPDHRYQSCAELIEDLQGLDLANEALSFIDTGEAPKARPGAPTSARPGKRPVTTAGRPGARTAAPPPEEEEPSEWWYVSFKTPEGKQVTRKLKEEQVLALIKAENFDPEAQASRNPKTGFRDLATYREFEPTLRGRMTKARADRKAEKYRSMYKKIEEEEKSYQRWKRIRAFFQSTAGWVWLLIWLAALAAAGYLVYLLAPSAWEWLASKLGFLK
jgi:serine/threonine-protein kinase